MEIQLFNRTLFLQDHHCSLNGLPPTPINGSFVNLYVQPTLKCNANCLFCEFKDNNCPDFDFDKFQKCLKEISDNRIEVRRVNITGGEPSLKIKLFHKITETIRDYFPNCFLGVNTNGSNIDSLFEASEYIDTVTVSHHHYLDHVNSSILGITAPKLRHLSRYADRLHLSCNLMKGFIYNKRTVKNYLTSCIKNGIKDVGFVTLMKVNKYCENHFIDFNDVFKEEELDALNIIGIRTWNNGDSCKCKNYAFISETHKDAVKFYARHYCKSNNNQNTLVFNGKNLTVGFDKTDIII